MRERQPQADDTQWLSMSEGFPGGSVVKNPPENAGVIGSIPGLRTSHGLGNGNPLQYSCLGNPMDRGVWWGYSPWTCKGSDVTEHARTHTHTHTHCVLESSYFNCIKQKSLARLTKGQLVKQLRAKTWILLDFRGSTETH